LRRWSSGGVGLCLGDEAGRVLLHQQVAVVMTPRPFVRGFG
jgi:hypothetical protein